MKEGEEKAHCFNGLGEPDDKYRRELHENRQLTTTGKDQLG